MHFRMNDLENYAQQKGEKQQKRKEARPSQS
jgi:hypothetical protein